MENDDKLVLSFCIGLASGPFSYGFKWLLICIIVWEIFILVFYRDYPIGYRILLNLAYFSGWCLGNAFSTGHLILNKHYDKDPPAQHADYPYDYELNEKDVKEAKIKYCISYYLSHYKRRNHRKKHHDNTSFLRVAGDYSFFVKKAHIHKHSTRNQIKSKTNSTLNGTLNSTLAE
jgi:hypothetical protein